MAENRFFVNLSEQLFGSAATYLEEYFEDLKKNLIMADLPYTLHEYLSTAILSSSLIFFVSVISISIVIGAMTGTIAGVISGVLTGLFGGVFFGVLTFMLFYSYPSVALGSRRTNIENNLPFATIYLSTIAGTGTPPAALFKLLSEFEEYGEVSNEAKEISRDIYTFGAGTTEALRSAAQRTPSDNFKELLWGITSIITTGGDLRAFLREKSEAYMAEYRRRLDKFTDVLSLLMEMYITLVIVGSVFLIIISSIMSALGENVLLIVAIQILTVVVLLPMAAIMFIVLVKGVSPLE